VTEVEWLACSKPEPMLEFLRGKARVRVERITAGNLLSAVGLCYGRARIEGASKKQPPQESHREGKEHTEG
jgi:hypothetical protein